MDCASSKLSAGYRPGQMPNSCSNTVAQGSLKASLGSKSSIRCLLKTSVVKSVEFSAPLILTCSRQCVSTAACIQKCSASKCLKRPVPLGCAFLCLRCAHPQRHLESEVTHHRLGAYALRRTAHGSTPFCLPGTPCRDVQSTRPNLQAHPVGPLVRPIRVDTHVNYPSAAPWLNMLLSEPRPSSKVLPQLLKPAPVCEP